MSPAVSGTGRGWASNGSASNLEGVAIRAGRSMVEGAMNRSTRATHVSLKEAVSKGPPPAGNPAVPIFLFNNVPWLPPSRLHHAANGIHHDVGFVLVDEMTGAIHDLPLAAF